MRDSVIAHGLDGFAAELIDDAPCGIAVADASGRFVYVNRTLAGWIETGPSRLIGTPVGEILTVPGRLFFETHVRPMLRLQGFAREIACELERPGAAEPLPAMMNAVWREAQGAQPARIDLTLFDATERAKYERSLRAARAEADQLAAVVRTSPNAILRVDDRGRVQSWNRGAERMFGVAAEQARGRPVEELIEIEDRPDWLISNMEVCHSKEGVHFEAEYGPGRFMEVTIASIGEATWRSGRAAYSVILRDVSDRARAERSLRLTVGEMRHRVKNTLAVVQSIARQTFDRGRDPGAMEKFQSRLAALARAQDLLADKRGKSAGLQDLVSLCAEEAGGAERLSADGPDLTLPAGAVSTLSMVLHELMTNAMKYGALSVPEGRVRIRWTLATDDPERILLEWQETGGPPVAAPESRGFGTRMIDMVMSAEFGGRAEFDFRPAGLCLNLTIRYEAPAA